MKDQVSLYVLSACVLLYIVILPNIDYDLLQLINSLPVKLIFALIVIYCSTISPCIAIIVLLIYVLSIQQYNTTKNVEGFMDIINKLYKSQKKPGSKNSVLAVKELDVKESLPRESNMGKLCECPEVKDQPKHTNDKDPKDSRNYNIDKWPIFTPIVPVK